MTFLLLLQLLTPSEHLALRQFMHEQQRIDYHYNEKLTTEAKEFLELRQGLCAPLYEFSCDMFKLHNDELLSDVKVFNRVSKEYFDVLKERLQIMDVQNTVDAQTDKKLHELRKSAERVRKRLETCLKHWKKLENSLEDFPR